MQPETAERRAEIDERQAAVSDLLGETACDHLLLLEPANVHWFCGAPLARNILDSSEQPALILTGELRWLVSSQVDSQRLFESYLDNLGFQLKCWPWHIGRDQLLADLCENKKLACDRPVRDSVNVGDRLRRLRLQLTPSQCKSFNALGSDLAHALDATCRNIEPGDSEWEAAGHVGHRLLHHGIEPVMIQVAADGRTAADARPGFTEQTITQSATLMAMGQRDGLHVAATRTAWFVPSAAERQHAWDIAGQLAAARAAAIKPGVPANSVWIAGQGVAAALGREYDWHDSPAGWLTGWLPTEQLLGPQTDLTLSAGYASTWQCRIGEAWMLDTYLITGDHAELVTVDAEGPIRRFSLGTAVIHLPDVIRR